MQWPMLLIFQVSTLLRHIPPTLTSRHVLVFQPPRKLSTILMLFTVLVSFGIMGLHHPQEGIAYLLMSLHLRSDLNMMLVKMLWLAWHMKMLQLVISLLYPWILFMQLQMVSMRALMNQSVKPKRLLLLLLLLLTDHYNSVPLLISGTNKKRQNSHRLGGYRCLLMPGTIL